MELLALCVLLIGIPCSVALRFNDSRLYSTGNASDKYNNAAPQCKQKTSNCACQTNQGLIDLSLIDSKDPTKPSLQVDDIANPVRYYYNPCTPFDSGECKGAAVCRCIQLLTPPSCTVVGYHAADEFRVEDDRLTIVYSASAGTLLRSHVSLICGQSKQSDADFALHNTAVDDYYFTLTSLHACPVAPPKRGLSVGSLLVVAFFCLLIVYIVGGILFMHYAWNAEGFDMIPNLDFWLELPLLFQDGVVFTFSSLREFCGSRLESTYRQI